MLLKIHLSKSVICTFGAAALVFLASPSLAQQGMVGSISRYKSSEVRTYNREGVSQGTISARALPRGRVILSAIPNGPLQIQTANGAVYVRRMDVDYVLDASAQAEECRIITLQNRASEIDVGGTRAGAGNDRCAR